MKSLQAVTATTNSVGCTTRGKIEEVGLVTKNCASSFARFSLQPPAFLSSRLRVRKEGGLQRKLPI